jgi:hypothetical protein
MPYPQAACEQQAEALATASAASPCRQLRYELHNRSKEWARAAEAQAEIEAAGEPMATVELAGAVVAGMSVYQPSTAGDWCRVVRNMGSRDGQYSLHLEGPDGRDRYINLASATSPVVVMK